MTPPNVNRGDEFIVDDDMCRSLHFTCVGRMDDGFFAGDISLTVEEAEYVRDRLNEVLD